MKTLIYYFVIGALLSLLFIGIQVHYSQVDGLKKEYKISHDSLQKVTETQYKKLIDDSYTKKELRRKIDSLEIVKVKNPETIVITEVEIREITKPVDKLVVVEGKVEVEDFYPSKEKPFVKYTLKDTVSNFKFYPYETSIVVSENKDGTWQVDTKTPEFMTIKKVTAISQPKPKNKVKPFVVGASYIHYPNKSEFEVIGGFKIKNTFILGSANTNKGFGVKTLYNF